MKAVTKYIEAGMTAPDAIKQALTDKGTSVSKMARDHAPMAREELSLVINFRMVPRDHELAALAEELGGSSGAWYEFWWTHARDANRRTPPAKKARAVRRVQRAGR